jgi:RND family efflux transporter MFP subunit
MKQIQAYCLAWCCVVLLAPAYAEEPSANAQPDQHIVMGTLTSGVVSQVLVKAGQKVSKGDLLLALDNRALLAAIAQAKAEQKYTALLLEDAQTQDDRAQELYDRTVLSEHERTQSTIALYKAQAEHAKVQAALAEARKKLRESQLRAPFDTVVRQVNAHVGQAVTSVAGIPALIILDK